MRGAAPEERSFGITPILPNQRSATSGQAVIGARVRRNPNAWPPVG